MDTVVTVIDNGKLLKPQTLDETNKLTPYFQTLETDEKGKQCVDKQPEDWTYEMSGFESKTKYEEALTRKKSIHNSNYAQGDD